MLDKFENLFPRGKHVKEAKEAIIKWLPHYKIDTPLRICHFIAQIAHESGGLKYWYELGGKSYFSKYEGRKDLGNNKKGDGYKYRGRGLIQLTGRANYTEMSKKLGVDLINSPDLAVVPEIAIRIACEYWDSRKLNDYADKDNILGITRKINGGYNGLSDRSKWLSNLKKLFG